MTPPSFSPDTMCECGSPLGDHYTDGRAYYCTNPHHWLDGDPPKFRPAASLAEFRAFRSKSGERVRAKYGERLSKREDPA